MKRIGKLGRHNGLDKWYARVDGKQIYMSLSGQSEEEARAWYNALCEEAKLAERTAAENEAETSVATLVNYYLKREGSEGCEKHRKAKATILGQFAGVFGAATMEDVAPSDIKEWVKSHETWGDNYQRLVYKHVGACMNWLVNEGKITANPVKRIKKPSPVVRGDECLIDEDEYALLISKAKQPYREIMEVLYWTGARPDEILQGEAKMYQPEVDSSALVLPKGIAKAKDKVRTILLPARANEIIKARAEHVKKGLLFLSDKGNKIAPDVLNQYFQRLRETCNIEHPCSPYSFRHGFAYRHLKRGVPINIVATWLGNTVAVCEKHYGHGNFNIQATAKLMTG